ncbi:hypothetical protein ANN_11596 [Periplaneta americana]|uniref:Rho guanine nucleotide exchange factor 7 n=1 Tax=Periplaneta americana TaxID=6978 RepID=A0ABQ8T701_PERAM|nr:hypothetical protein ANN_11596 [Periplaneta americana]
MALDGTPFLVQAVYSFKGKNNDELCFKKGDIITITQREEGGWWEGTLGDKTGWFPSNYVKEYKTQETSPLAGKTSPSKLPPELIAQQKVYRNLVLKDLIDSEKAHVAELQGLLKNFLHPLEKSEILTREEYRQLVGNIGNVVETHQQLLSTLEDCNQRTAVEQRVGKVFLTSAPRIKQVHQAYCSSHPKAVCILDKYKVELNEFMESQGAASPGLLVLTTGLSKPFRRLEKYAGMLQELERHVEENHPDRGDTQRSVSVYKDIASSCSATRRQKELELEVLTGGVRGWEGEDLSCLGEILHMGSVAVGPDHRDRYLVLFPSTLLMLSVSQRMSAFIYEGKLPLTGINVTKLEDTEAYKNAFEITGSMIERILAVCQTKDDQHTWVEHLKQQIRIVRKSSVSSPSPATSPPPGKPQPLPPPHVSLPPASPYSELTAFFAELVQRGVITRKVLKRLLYAQFKEDGVGVNILGVKVRRSHKVECVIFPTRVSMGTYTVKQTWLKSSVTELDSDEEEEDDAEGDGSSSDTATNSSCSLQGADASKRKSGHLERQNAVDLDSDEDKSSLSSCASNPFGFIHYYSPKCAGIERSIEGFVDGRDAGLTEVCSESLSTKGSDLPGNRISTKQNSKDSKYSSSLSVSCNKKDSKSPGLIAAQQSSESSFERTSAHRSFPVGVCEDLTQLDDSNYSSSLSVSCNQKDSKSPGLIATQQSSESSFERTSAHRSFPTAVCEDLTQLDEVTPTTQTQLKGSCPQVRQSLPTFGPDNFCRPEPAPLYVPSCHFTSEKDLYTSCHGVCLDPKPQLSHSMPALPQEPYSPSTTHSSSLDMPANVIPVPTAVLAELLYNLEPISDTTVPKLVHQPDSASSDRSVESIQTVRDIPTNVPVTNTPPDTTGDAELGRKSSEFCPEGRTSTNLNDTSDASNQVSKVRLRRGAGLKSSLPKRCYSYHYISITESDSADTNKCTNTEHCRCCGEVPCSSRSSDSGLADIAGNSALPSPDMSGLLQDQDNSLSVTCCLKPTDGSGNCLGASISESALSMLVTPRESDEFGEPNYEAQCVCTSPFGSTPRTSAQASLTSEKIFVGSMDSVSPSVTSTSLDPSPLSASQPWCSSEESKEVYHNRGGIYRSGMYAHWWLKTKIPASAVRTEEPAPRPKTHYMCFSQMSPLTVPLSPRVSVPQPSSVRPTPQPVNKGWSMSCLRPSPPIRPCLALGRDDNHRKSSRSTKKQRDWIHHTPEKKGNCGRKRKTSPADDRLIVRKSKLNPRLTAVDLTRELMATTGANIHVTTVQCRLLEAGQRARKPIKKQLLTPVMCKKRLMWAKLHQHWTVNDWKNVLFSDESHFEVHGHRVSYVRKGSEKVTAAYLQQAPKYPPKVMFWGCITHEGPGALIPIKGMMNSHKYIHLLETRIVPQLQKSFPDGRDERSFEEDAQILRVIEAYCTSAKTRYTVNSGM